MYIGGEEYLNKSQERYTFIAHRDDLRLSQHYITSPHTTRFLRQRIGLGKSHESHSTDQCVGVNWSSLDDPAIHPACQCKQSHSRSK